MIYKRAFSLRKSCLSIALLGSLNISDAQAQPNLNEESKLWMALSLGYSQVDLNWSIAGNSLGTNPAILSELIWKNIQGPRLGAELEVKLFKRLTFVGQFSRTNILSGRATDSDYAKDNRESQTAFFALDSDSGFLALYETALGYKFKYKQLKMTALVGYGSDLQSLYLLDHRGRYDAALQSTYKANWKGGLIGLRSAFSLSKKFEMLSLIKYHQMAFSANGDWNLIAGFMHPVSYRHIANGFKVAGSLQVDYKLSSEFVLFLRGVYTYSNTGKGIDFLYYTNGQVAETQFNGASSRFFSVAPGLSLRF